jgi:hypothetical protein
LWESRRRHIICDLIARSAAIFNIFYARYVAACAALSVAPLSQAELLNLIETLVERAGATLQ